MKKSVKGGANNSMNLKKNKKQLGLLFGLVFYSFSNS
jgi:hypothetical protein